MESLFAAARYDECLASIERDVTRHSAAIAARALIRLGRLDEADAMLRRVAHSAEPSAFERAEIATLIATVAARRGRPDAEDRFSEARAYAFSVGDADLTAELTGFEALHAWQRGDPDRATEVLEDIGREHGRSVEADCLIRQLRGAIAAQASDFGTQLRLELENLDRLRASEARFVWAESFVLWNLAVLSRELDERGVAQLVRERAATLAWTDATATARFQTYSNLAWSVALVGDHAGAFELLRESAAVAPGDIGRVQALLDAASLSRELDEAPAFRERLDAAERLADAIAWDGASASERLALLQLGELLVPVDGARSAHWLERYRAMSGARPPRGPGNERITALEQYRFGLEAVARGDAHYAETALRAAFAYFRSVEFIERATAAAIDIFELTAAEDARRYAAENVDRWPRSWIARRFERAAGHFAV